MDGGTATMIPEGDRLGQFHCLSLFGPTLNETVWVSRDGTTLLPRGGMLESDVDAWRAAWRRGEVDTADLEWRLHDFGVSQSDVRAQLEVTARVLDDLGIKVEWEADRLGFVFLHGSGEEGVIREGLGLQAAVFGPIRVFDHCTGEAFTPERIRRQAVAFLDEMWGDVIHCGDAVAFAAEHRIGVPAAALEGMEPWQREWAVGSIRLGACGFRVVAFTRDRCAEPHCIYDGPDMNEAIRAIRKRAGVIGAGHPVAEATDTLMQGDAPRPRAAGASA